MLRRGHVLHKTSQLDMLKICWGGDLRTNDGVSGVTRV